MFLPNIIRLDVLIVRSGKIVRNQQDGSGAPPARDLDPNDPSAASNASRPQRQCTTRSLAYRFVEQNSEDEED